MPQLNTAFNAVSTPRDARDKRGVYAGYMDTPLKELLDRAKKGAMSDTDLAVAMGLETVQVLSNWKKRGRLPPERYKAAAEAVGCTIDALVYGKRDLREPRRPAWPFTVSEAATCNLPAAALAAINAALAAAIAAHVSTHQDPSRSQKSLKLTKTDKKNSAAA